MKLLTLVSIFALTAATGAFAQSESPTHNQNPNNCSPAERDCASSADGTGSNAVAPRTMPSRTETQAAVPAAPPMAGTDPTAETATAAQHAGLAAAATDMKMTQMHLHHVVNCLVGPTGKEFNAAAGNPCKDQGAGAIHDTKMGTHQHHVLRQALSRANAGLKTTDIKVAQKDAARAQTLLTPKAPKTM